MKRENVEIAILGDSGSGKTALMRALDHRAYSENIGHTTQPGFLNARPTAHDPNPAIPMNVVDVPDHKRADGVDNRYRFVTHNTDVAMICFDTSEVSSFNEAKDIHRMISQQSSPNAQVFLVGTKTDLPRTERSVSQGEVLQYADREGIKYVSCSAKTGAGVEEAFETAKSQVLESRAPKTRPVMAETIVEKNKESVPEKKTFGFGKKSASKPVVSAPQKESKPKAGDNPNTLEIVLSGIKLSKEQRVSFNAVSVHTDAHVMAQTQLLNRDVNYGSAWDDLKSGGKIIAQTERAGRGDKISITVQYSDQNASKTMEEVANRIFNVAATQQDTLELSTSHDESKLLAKALANKNLYPKEQVYRVNIQGMTQDLNKYGPPAFFDTEKINKKLIQDPVTDELKSLQQSVVTPDGKGVMTATANYLPPDQDSKRGARLANQIQVELRPNTGQSLDANTVKAFRAEVENMRQGGTVQVDASNPREFNALLMPQQQAQQAAPVAAVVQKQAESAHVQEEKSSRRTSRMPPIALSRQQSIGELESFSPRDNQSNAAKANPKLEKTPTSENVLKQVDEMADKLFESPRGEEASPAEKSPLIQRLQSKSAKSKSAPAAAATQDSDQPPPSPGKK